MKKTSYWGDGRLFNVSFTTEENKTFHRMIVVENPSNEDDIRMLFHSTFPAIQSIDYIDECEDVLLMKGATES